MRRGVYLLAGGARRWRGADAMDALRKTAADLRRGGGGDKKALAVAYELLRQLTSLNAMGEPLVADHYNFVLGYMVRARRIQLGWSVLEEMEACGVAKDRITYESIIALHARERDAEKVKDTLRTMKREGVVPTTASYTYLLEVSPAHDAVRILGAMTAAGINPAMVHYNAAVRKQCAPAAAAPVLHAMKCAGLRPDVDTYGALLTTCGDDTTRAELIFKSMEVAGVKPRASTYNMLAAVYKNKGDFAGACRAMALLSEAGHPPRPEHFGVLIKAILTARLPRDEALQQADLIFTQAEAAGAVSQILYARVMEVYQTHGDRGRAEALLAKLRAEGLEAHPALRDQYEQLLARH